MKLDELAVLAVSLWLVWYFVKLMREEENP